MAHPPSSLPWPPPKGARPAAVRWAQAKVVGETSPPPRGGGGVFYNLRCIVPRIIFHALHPFIPQPRYDSFGNYPLVVCVERPGPRMSNSVTVAVRARPLNAREKRERAKVSIQIEVPLHPFTHFRFYNNDPQ